MQIFCMLTANFVQLHSSDQPVLHVPDILFTILKSAKSLDRAFVISRLELMSRCLAGIDQRQPDRLQAVLNALLHTEHLCEIEFHIHALYLGLQVID